MTHTPHGGAVTVAAMPVYEDGSPHAAGACAVRFTVSDTGHGIAPEHLPLIFERFFRADASRARSTGGAGLGLTIVRQLVEAHGGRVWAESEPKVGTTVRFTLPTAA
jgi:signal transduction histidine kinase